MAFQALHIMVNALGSQQLRLADAAIRIDVHDVYTKCGAEATVELGRLAVRKAWPEILLGFASRSRQLATP
jgi:hypothetical protein